MFKIRVLVLFTLWHDDDFGILFTFILHLGSEADKASWDNGLPSFGRFVFFFHVFSFLSN
jgi:hypothetical protein